MSEPQEQASLPKPSGTESPRRRRRGPAAAGRNEPVTKPPKIERNAGGLRKSYVDFLAWLITGIWSVSFLADMGLKEYDPPATIHALMMIVAGAAFGGTLIRSKSDGE